METSNSNLSETSNNIPVFKVEPIMVLLFGFLTCGLYFIYWNMKVAKVVNAVAKEDLISTPVAVFSGFCLPVSIYFYYILGKQGMPHVYRKIGDADKDQSTLLILLGLFFPFAAAMIVQGDINRLYQK